MPLPPASLPLRFVLLANGRRGDATPCLVTTLRGIEIHRILDPEFREPFVSCARIFAAAREAPLTGLFRFDLQPYAYDTTLAGLAPYEDVWVSLTIARRVANELGLADDLAGLLDWDSRFAWTIADKEEAALRHNWRIPPNSLPEERYSTSAMLETDFPAPLMLATENDLRTHIPPAPYPPAIVEPSWESQWRQLVRWTLLLFEEHLEGLEGLEHVPSESSGEAHAIDSRDSLPSPSLASAPAFTDVASLTPTFLWSILATQLDLSFPSSSPHQTQPYTFADGHLTARKGDTDLVARLALSDVLSRLVLHDWHRHLLNVAIARARSETKTLQTTSARALDVAVELRGEMRAVDERLSSEQASLREELTTLRERLARKPETPATPPPMMAQAPSTPVGRVTPPPATADWALWLSFALGSAFTAGLAVLLRR